MDTLDGMKTVIAVVETGSFTAAGERLGISKALVSKYVGAVEDHLGARLFNRSTRRLAITEAGKHYYDRIIPLLDEYNELVENVAGEEATPRGILRISAPVTFGESSLCPLLPQLTKRFPELSIDLQLTDRKIDMLQEGIDVVIRIGGVDDSNLIARKIKQFPLIMCASPDYLARVDCPKTPADLEQHCIVIDSNFRIGKTWPLIDSNGKTHIANVVSRLAVNSPRAVTEITVNGGGIALIPEFVCTEQLNSGELVPIMQDYSTLEFTMFAIYPHRRYVAKKVRSFVEFLYENFAD